MLEDREYMRQPSFGGSGVSFTLALVIVNVAIFLAEWLALRTQQGSDFIGNYLA